MRGGVGIVVVVVAVFLVARSVLASLCVSDDLATVGWTTVTLAGLALVALRPGPRRDRP